MGEHTEKLKHMGILLYGPRRDEYAIAIEMLLGGKLPQDWEWVNSSPNTIVARRLQPSLAYFKEFLSRSAFERLKALIRGSRCQRAILRGEILRRRGFHSPIVICWGKKGQRHFMITEGLEAVSLPAYMEKNWLPPLSGKELIAKRTLIEKLGMEIGELHKKGICHGDLRLSNILLQETENDSIFHFIDNERSLFFRKIPRRLIVKNLVQANMIFLPIVTRQDRLRFLEAYCKTYGRFNSEEKIVLIQDVYERTMERLTQKKARLAKAAAEKK